jgi:hypothetical protein
LTLAAIEKQPLNREGGNRSSCPIPVIAQVNTPDLKRTFGDAASGSVIDPKRT